MEKLRAKEKAGGFNNRINRFSKPPYQSQSAIKPFTEMIKPG